MSIFNDDWLEEGEDLPVNNSWGNWRNWYKPKFDLSVGLQQRVAQLIKTITNKTLIVKSADGWGSNDKYFFYNPSDLENASDDEVLGRILHQLARELNIDQDELQKLVQKEIVYRELLNTLEDNRADRALQSLYGGVGYYSQELWQSRKEDDNPRNRYPRKVEIEEYLTRVIYEDSTEDQKLERLKEWNDGTIDPEFKVSVESYYQDYLKRLPPTINNSWEFCFNINALQNKETTFDFSDDKMAENFTNALPFIDEYLNAPNLQSAKKAFEEIKKYYPVPTSKEQTQMFEQMSETESLSPTQVEAYSDKVDRIESNQREIHDAEEYFFSGNTGKKERQFEQNLSLYQTIKTKYAGTINTLSALIRSILQDNAIKRFQKPFKRGKLDAKNIYKYLATDNIRIFKKPRGYSDKKYSMALVVDQSGSMEGTLSQTAVEATVLMIEVFESLGFPYEVIGFDDIAYKFKGFEQRMNKAMIPSLNAYNAGGGTNDLRALTALQEDIKKFDPKKTFHKGIFVITDGEGRTGETKDLITKMEEEENVTVFGIGIGNVSQSALDRTYNHNVKVATIQELPKQLITLMKAQFRRNN